MQENKLEELGTGKAFLDVLKFGKAKHVPFWMMRQAGRYLPEYRDLRAEKGGFLALAFDPEAASEVTMQPIRRFGMDAAIIFSDILVIPYALGQHLEFMKGEGPRLEPLRSRRDLESLNDQYFDEKLEPVYQALSLTREKLAQEGFHETALIGFAGAPWTVATYMIEGQGSKDYAQTKRMAFAQVDDFQFLIDLLVRYTARYLIAQVKAGAEALQIFDSWAGVLSEPQFKRWALEPVKEIIRLVKNEYPDVPIIAFPRGAGENYKDFALESGADALGIDTSMHVSWAMTHLQPHVPVQGNLDPMCLFAGGQVLENEMRRIFDGFSGGPFIFNLGHGIHKETPIEHVEQMVAFIRNYKS